MGISSLCKIPHRYDAGARGEVWLFLSDLKVESPTSDLGRIFQEPLRKIPNRRGRSLVESPNTNQTYTETWNEEDLTVIRFGSQEGASQNVTNFAPLFVVH